MPAPLRNNRFFGNHTRVVAHTKDRIDTGKHAGPQLKAAIVNTSPNTDRAAIGVNQRINGLHLGGVLAARQGINVKQSGLPAFDLALKTLWQPEVHINSLNVFNVDNIGTIFQVVTYIDLADTGDAVKWSKNFQARCCGLGQ